MFKPIHSIAPLVACVACVAPLSAAADAVTDWNANAAAAALAACIAPADDPLHESRMYAMLHLAAHDALNAIERRSRPYAYDAQAPAGTSPDAAVAAAARDVLVAQIAQIPAPFPPACIDAGIARAEADYAAALAAIADGPAKTQGIALGQAAAAAINAQRSGDGADTPLIVADYPQGTQPGEWRFTPGFDFAFAPGWGGVAPFALAQSSQFRPPPPLAVACTTAASGARRGCARYAADVAEVKALGGDGVTTPSARTAEQTEIARFWVESSPLLWNRVARSVSAAEGLDLWQTARLFGLLNAALADGYVGSWDTKFHDNFWRPVTAIREAANDGNPATEADPTWTPLLPTPPIPDYDSGHSVQGGAAAGVLARIFGDATAFSACSLTLPPGSTCNDPTPVLRHFASFSAAAQENADSRVYVGFHFRDAVQRGMAHGRRIGQYAVATLLRPIGH